MTEKKRATVSTQSLYGKLEAGSDAQLERLLRLLAEAVEMETAAVALVGDGGRIGRLISFRPVDRDVAQVMLLGARAEVEPFVAADARETGLGTGPSSRFPMRAAGMRLTAPDGALIGMLCILDPSSGVIGPRELGMMRTAALAVEGHVATLAGFSELRARHERQIDELCNLRGLLGATALFPSITTDASGTITSLNAAAERCLCARAEEVVGRLAITAFAGDEPGLAFSAMLGAARDGGVEERDLGYRRRDGTRFLAQVSVSAVRQEEGGQVTGYVFVLQDVTARRRGEEATRRQRDELAHANRELARSTRLKDDFIAGMSRELRTPLNAILGLTEALDERVYGPLGDEQRKAVLNIRGSGLQLQALADDVIDLFKAEAMRLELDIQAASIGDVCRDCLQRVQDAAHRRHLALSLRLDEAPGSIEADRARLTQALVTLWRSAIESASEGGATGLTVSIDPAVESVGFTIWDTGIGLSRADREQFFEAFGHAQPDGTTVAGRTGVGLALARRIIELHHGEVALDAEAGRGMELTVTIPRRYERLSVAGRRSYP